MEVTNFKTKTTTKSLADYDLVKQAINGNQFAFATLVERYRQSIYHTIYKMVNNNEDAEDLTMEAFAKAFKKLSSYAPNYAFSTWLFKIAINNTIDYIRKKKLHTMSIDEPLQINGKQDFAQNLNSGTSNPEQVMIHAEKLRTVRAYIDKLSAKYKMMIELRYFEELSYEEIAEELDIPLGTVKAQLFRAKELLHQLMQAGATKSFLDVKDFENKTAVA
jgi:RNA polymerase sigma factor (sigma-70 family)